jgi:hypothetical protein
VLAQCTDVLPPAAADHGPATRSRPGDWGKDECIGQGLYSGASLTLEFPSGVMFLRPRVWKTAVLNFDSLPNGFITLFMVLNQAGLGELLRSVSSVTAADLQPLSANRA